MGFFDSMAPYDSMRKYLISSDKFVHLLMINSFGKFTNQSFGCDGNYTEQINDVLTGMQRDGFEIIDVKFNSLSNHGSMGVKDGFNTLITYRYTR